MAKPGRPAKTRKTGRPRIDINWDEFRKLCEHQCAIEEIASWFDCSVDTIERRVKEEYDQTFAEVFDHLRGKGKIALRRKQFQRALYGSDKMLIHLGKHYLGQKDAIELTGKEGGPIEHEVVHKLRARLAALRGKEKAPEGGGSEPGAGDPD